MDNLERITEKTPSLYQKIKNGMTNYLVDVSAGLIFYNPIMAALEYSVAEMESWEIKSSRIGASIAQAICMRPSGMLRNYSAERFNLTKESPWYLKGLSDTVSILSLQVPSYSLALYNSGVSLEEGGKALASAAFITTIMNNGTTIGFGKWMDFWRGIWRKKKAIK